MRVLIGLAVMLGVAAWGQRLQFATVREDILLERLNGIARGDNQQRHDAVAAMFRKAACGELSDEKAKGSKLPNIVCPLPGKLEDLILVTAHYDKVRAGAGAIDNWSGVSLLPSLYESMYQMEGRKFTFLFIAFTDEEAGLVGSRAWVAANKKTLLPRVRAVINIDSVASGPHPLYIWASRANPELGNAALGVAAALKIPLEGMNADKVGDSDVTPFRDAKVPVIDFHSLNNKTFPLLHTIDDQLSKVDVDAYKSAYRFLALYLTYLDQKLAPAGSAIGGLK